MDRIIDELSRAVCRIIAAQVSDSGRYLCMAKNSLGSILTATQLTVRGTMLCEQCVCVVLVLTRQVVEE